MTGHSHHRCAAGHCLRMAGPALLLRTFDRLAERHWWPHHFGCTEFQRNHH